MGIIIGKIGLFLLAYLLGSIPNGLIIGKLFLKIDLREEGSKNIGTSNALRVMGLYLGSLTLLLDALKAAAVVLFVIYLLPEAYGTIALFGNLYNIAVLYGVVAVIGHTFSIFIKFKGGKAVAASLGVVFSLTPIIGVVALLTYIIVVIITKYASIGSTIAAIAVGIGAMIQFYIQNTLNENLFLIIIYWIMILFIFYKHIPNYKRLLKKEENKMQLGTKNKSRNSQWVSAFFY